MDELINKKITICYGPLSWFSELVEKEKKKLQEEDVAHLLSIVRLLDSKRKNLLEDDYNISEEFKIVIAESGSYASLHEHVITNFVGLLDSFVAEHVYLHNPPNDVHEQLDRYYDLQVEYYSYPSVKQGSLFKRF